MLPRTLYESLTKKTMATLSLKLMMIPFQTNKVQANNEYDLHHRLPFKKCFITKPGKDDKSYFRYFSLRKTFLSGNDML